MKAGIWTVAVWCCLSAAMFLPNAYSQSSSLSKEYIYVGSRLIAVEQAGAAVDTDLEVVAMTSGGQGLSSGSLQISFEYSNTGAATSQASRVAFYFSPSPDNVIETSDTVSPTTHPIPTGFSGSSGPISLTIQIPTLAVGSYFLGAFIDDQDLVAESSDANNTRLSATGGGQAGDFSIVTPGAASPEVISLLPTSATEPIQIFRGTFRDGDGASDIASVRLLVNSSQSHVDACYVQYVAGAGFSLRNDADSAWIDAGTSAVVGNGQCLVDAAASDASLVGGDLVVEWAITATSALSSGVPRSVWLEATDLSSNSTVSAALGSWTVPSPNLSLSAPTIPGGNMPTEDEEFTVSVQIDNVGPQIVETVAVGFYATTQSTSTPPTPAPSNRIGSCGVSLTNGFPANGSAVCSGVAALASAGPFRIWAIADDQGSILEADEGDNSLQVGDVDVQQADPPGDSDLIVTQLFAPQTMSQGGSATAVVSFKNQGSSSTDPNPGVPGPGGGFDVTVYLSTDSTITSSDTPIGVCPWVGGLNAGFDGSCSQLGLFVPTSLSLGTYYVGAIADSGDVINEVVESNNSLLSHNGQMTITAASQSGPDISTYVSSVWPESAPGDSISVGVTVTNQGSQVAVGPFSADIYLSTSSSYSISSDTALGGCTVAATPALNPASSATPPWQASCSTTVTLPPGLANGQYYVFARSSYANSQNDLDFNNNFDFERISIQTPANPEALSVTPSVGSGAAQVFTLQYRDENGASDVTDAFWLLNGALTWAGSCGVWYDQANNQLYITDDGEFGWRPNPITPGAGTLSNGSCSIDGSGVLVSSAGEELELTLPVAFVAGLGSVQTHWAAAADAGGRWSGWTNVGTWTLPGTTNQAPVAAAMEPQSGSGSTQSFAFTYSDPDGATDIVSVRALINSTLTGVQACFAILDRDANRVYLFDDAQSLAPGGDLGSATILENGSCRLDLSTTSVSVSGDDLTWNQEIEFLPSFNGPRNAYTLAIDSSGQPSSWATFGPWVVTSVPAFQESGGEVVVEAESGDVTNYSHSWIPKTAQAGFSGAAYLEAAPNNQVNLDTNYVGVAPEAAFLVNFANTGTYRVWVRAAGGGSDNSVHVGIDGQATPSADRLEFDSDGSWNWSSVTRDGASPATLTIATPGTRKVSVWMREDGARFDKLLLTTDTGFVPTGTGPLESGYGSLYPEVGNPGFESGTAAPWLPYGVGTVIVPSSSNPRVGSSSLEVTSSTAGGAFQDVSGLLPGQTYEISAWVTETSGTTGAVALFLHDGLGGNQLVTNFDPSASGFQQITATYVANQTGAVRIHLHYYGDSAGAPAGITYWDDITVSPVGDN